MNIALINPPVYATGNEGIIREKKVIFSPIEISDHLGLGYLASSLEANKFNVKIIDSDLEGLSIEATLAILSEYKPTLIGVYLLHDTFIEVSKLLKAIKTNFSSPIVIGGPLPTIALEKLYNYTNNFDYLVVGDGEQTIVKLAQSINNKKDPECNGLIWKDKTKIRFKAHSTPFNLDSIKDPYRPHAETSMKKQKEHMLPTSIHLVSGRGCNGACHFCSINSYNQHWIGLNKKRYRSAEKVIEEIRKLNKKYHPDLFVFNDDNFISDIRSDYERVDELIELLGKEKFKIQFALSIRPDTFDLNIINKLVNVGLVHIGIGIENISQQSLNWFNKGYSNILIPNLIEDLNKIGLAVTFYMILYHPFVSIEEIKQNFKFLYELGVFENDNGRRAYNYLLASRLLVRKFTMDEKKLGCLKIKENYKNPMIIPYKFKDNKVEIMWAELYKETMGRENETLDIFKYLIAKHC